MIEHWRDGELLSKQEVPNGITDEGLDHILNTQFHGGTPITTWYVGLINNSGFTGLDDGDIMSSHTGWTESTSYSGGARPTWGAGAASGRQITNGTTADFNINAPATIYGLFIVGGTGGGTPGGTTGTLWSTAAFSTPYAVLSGDVLKITYTLSG